MTSIVLGLCSRERPAGGGARKYRQLQELNLDCRPQRPTCQPRNWRWNGFFNLIIALAGALRVHLRARKMHRFAGLNASLHFRG